MNKRQRKKKHRKMFSGTRCAVLILTRENVVRFIEDCSKVLLEQSGVPPRIMSYNMSGIKTDTSGDHWMCGYGQLGGAQ